MRDKMREKYTKHANLLTRIKIWSNTYFFNKKQILSNFFQRYTLLFSGVKYTLQHILVPVKHKKESIAL